MSLPKTIEFALGQHDYIVGGRPLLNVLSEYAVTNKEACFYPLNEFADVRERLIGKSDPNYLWGRHALYHCPYCGGEDGMGLSANIQITNDYVIWCNFGWGSDMDESCITPFQISPTLRFDRGDYMQAFETFKPSPEAVTS